MLVAHPVLSCLGAGPCSTLTHLVLVLLGVPPLVIHLQQHILQLLLGPTHLLAGCLALPARHQYSDSGGAPGTTERLNNRRSPKSRRSHLCKTPHSGHTWYQTGEIKRQAVSAVYTNRHLFQSQKRKPTT